MLMENFHRLTLVTQKGTGSIVEYLKFLGTAIDNGVSAVQLREKNLERHALYSFALKLRDFLTLKKTCFIVNDNLELAINFGADGLHIGQNDEDVAACRKALGNNKILGLSVNSMEHVLKANDLPINYIGVGPIFSTKNKKDAPYIWNCDNLREAVLNSRHKVIAIGGIDLHNARDALMTGADGIAAIGAFHDAKNLTDTTKHLVNFIKEKVC